jgi:phosphate transport system protein
MLSDSINQLKKDIVNYASFVQIILQKTIKGLISKEYTMLHGVINIDEPLANERELILDEECINIIAQYSPKALALRTVITIMRMNNDLERIADHAVNICNNGLELIKYPVINNFIDISRMSDEVINMLDDSIKSFINGDADLAKNVCRRDNIVDALRDKFLRDLVNIMSADSKNIEQSINLINISKNLERIADLSTNIAENTIFIVKGKIIKHNKEEL